MARKNTYIGSENNVYVEPTSSLIKVGTDADIADGGLITAGTASGISCEVHPYGGGWCVKTTLTAVAMTTTDGDTAGAYCGVKLFDFATASSRIHALGGVINFSSYACTTGGGTGMASDATIAVGVGSTLIDAGAGIDIIGGDASDADFIEDQVLADLAAKAGTNSGVIESTTGIVASADSSYLNFSVAAADHGATADTLTVTGTVYQYFNVL